MTAPPALLLIGSATPDGPDADALGELVGELGSHSPEIPIATGFTGAAETAGTTASSPNGLGPAVDELAEAGAQSLAAVPLDLEAAGRQRGDLTAALAAETLRHPGLSYACGRALGSHPALLELLEQRLEEALDGTARFAGDRAGTWVLLVGHGSADAEANSEVSRAARLLWEGSGYAGVETAFVSVAAPDVTLGLDRCVRLGAERVVVLPYFLLSGALPERIRQQTAGWSAVHPEVEVRHADVIGPVDQLTRLVLERYREAAASGGGRLCAECANPTPPAATEETSDRDGDRATTG